MQSDVYDYASGSSQMQRQQAEPGQLSQSSGS